MFYNSTSVTIDIGSIMYVKSLGLLEGAVSWTDRPFEYFFHTIDRSRVSANLNQLIVFVILLLLLLLLCLTHMKYYFCYY